MAIPGIGIFRLPTSRQIQLIRLRLDGNWGQTPVSEKYNGMCWAPASTTPTSAPNPSPPPSPEPDPPESSDSGESRPTSTPEETAEFLKDMPTMQVGGNYDEEDVIWLQDRLCADFRLPAAIIDLNRGVYDEKTAALVRQYQQKHRLLQDKGIAGSQVQVSLKSGGKFWAPAGRVEDLAFGDIRAVNPTAVVNFQEAMQRAEDNTRLAAVEMSAALESGDEERIEKAYQTYAAALAYQGAIAAARARAQGATEGQVQQVVAQEIQDVADRAGKNTWQVRAIAKAVTPDIQKWISETSPETLAAMNFQPQPGLKNAFYPELWSISVDWNDNEAALRAEPPAAVRARADMDGPTGRLQFETDQAASNLNAAQASAARGNKDVSVQKVKQRYDEAIIEEIRATYEEQNGVCLTDEGREQLFGDKGELKGPIQTVVQNHSDDLNIRSSVVSAVIKKRAALRAEEVGTLESGGSNEPGGANGPDSSSSTSPGDNGQQISPLAARAGVFSIYNDLENLDDFGVSDPDGTIEKRVIEDTTTRNYVKIAGSNAAEGREGSAEVNGLPVRNGRVDYTIQRRDTATALSGQFGYTPDLGEFKAAYPQAGRKPDLIFTGDTIEFLTPQRIQKMRHINELMGGEKDFSKLSKEKQDEICRIIEEDIAQGADEAGTNGQLVADNVGERGGDFKDYLPQDVKGLDRVIGSAQDNVLKRQGAELAPRGERIQQVRQIMGDEQDFNKLSPEKQAQIRGLIGMDFIEGERGLGLDQEELQIELNHRATDWYNYLTPSVQSVVVEEQARAKGSVERVMGPMREDIQAGLDGDKEAWERVRTELISQMDADVDAEADIKPDLEHGIMRRTEEKVVRDYGAMVMELLPEASREQAGVHVNAAAEEILVQRPAMEVAEAYRQPADTGDKVANFFNWFGDGKDTYIHHAIQVLDENTAKGRDGQPMSAERANDIIMASRDVLQDGMAHSLHGGDYEADIKTLAAIAGRATSHAPGAENFENTGTQLIAKLMIDNGLDIPEAVPEAGSYPYTAHGNAVYGTLRIDYRENGEGVELNMALAAEYVRRGEKDKADLVLSNMLEDTETFYRSAAEAAQEFRHIFQDNAAYTYFEAQGILPTGQDGNFTEGMLGGMRAQDDSGFTKFMLNRDDYEDIHSKFYSNQQNMISIMIAFEELPEELQKLDGGKEIENFRSMTQTVLDDRICLAPLEDYEGKYDKQGDYQADLQFAFLGSEFSEELVNSSQNALLDSVAGRSDSPIDADTQKWLTEQDEEFYTSLISDFDMLQARYEKEKGTNEATLEPPKELVEFRAGFGNREDAALALKNNPDAVAALMQYLYANSLAKEYSPGFAVRAAVDLALSQNAESITRAIPSIGNTVEGNIQATENIRRRNAGRALGAMMYSDIHNLPRAMQAGIQRWYFKPDGELRTPPAEKSIYGHPYIGPPANLLTAGLNAWGVKDFWPNDWSKMIPGNENFKFWSDDFIYGIWGPYFAAQTVRFGALGGAGAIRTGVEAFGKTPPWWTDFSDTNVSSGGVRTMIFNKLVAKTTPVAMGSLVFHEAIKGDYAMALGWTPGFYASLCAAFPAATASTWWGGPVAIGVAWVVSGAGTYGLSKVRQADSANAMEGPMADGLEAAGMPRENAEALANATGEGEWTLRKMAAAGEQYFNIDHGDMFQTFSNVSPPDLVMAVRLSHQLEYELNDGRAPEVSKLSDKDKQCLAAIYFYLHSKSMDGAESLPFFAAKGMPTTEIEVANFLYPMLH